MKPDEFDLQLMDEMSQLPPPAPEVHDYTPWQASIRKIIWGMVLVTFRFEFFSLQYLLPLLGTTLLYLGYRSLRKSDPWFTLCWGLSAFLLVLHIAYDILTATPIMAQITQNTVLNNSLTALMVVANAVILFALRAGIRRRFVSITGEKPKDWLGRGLVAYLQCLALALWSTLEPATESGLFGDSITNDWLYYGRPIAAIVLQIYLLVCIFRQSESLVGQGYDIVPAPVRVPGKRFVLGVFLLVLLASLPALWLSSRLPTGEAREVTASLAGEQTAVRDHLIELGLPQELADTLDEAELTRCKDAYAVETGSWEDVDLTDEERPQTEGHDILIQVEDTQARLSVWLVFLPQGQVRWYSFFQYDTLPALRLQEQFSLSVSGIYSNEDYTSALFWQEGDATISPISRYSWPADRPQRNSTRHSSGGMRKSWSGWDIFTTPPTSPSPSPKRPPPWAAIWPTPQMPANILPRKTPMITMITIILLFSSSGIRLLCSTTPSAPLTMWAVPAL